MKFLDFFFKSFIFEYNHSKTVSGVFHDLKNVKIAEKSLKIGQYGTHHSYVLVVHTL
jgi:hypothetical protein